MILIDTIQLRAASNNDLINMVNVASLSNGKSLLRLSQKVMLGGMYLNVKFVPETQAEFYKYQLPTEMQLKLILELEKYLYNTEKDFVSENPNTHFQVVVNIKEQTFKLTIEQAVFVYSLEKVYSLNLYNYLKKVKPELMNEESLAFYESGLSFHPNILQHFKFKNNVTKD